MWSLICSSITGVSIEASLKILNSILSSSYYKKILAKQHEMNDAEGDTTQYIHDPRWTLLMVITHDTIITLAKL